MATNSINVTKLGLTTSTANKTMPTSSSQGLNDTKNGNKIGLGYASRPSSFVESTTNNNSVGSGINSTPSFVSNENNTRPTNMSTTKVGLYSTNTKPDLSSPNTEVTTDKTTSPSFITLSNGSQYDPMTGNVLTSSNEYKPSYSEANWGENSSQYVIDVNSGKRRFSSFDQYLESNQKSVDNALSIIQNRQNYTDAEVQAARNDLGNIILEAGTFKDQSKIPVSYYQSVYDALNSNNKYFINTIEEFDAQINSFGTDLYNTISGKSSVIKNINLKNVSDYEKNKETITKTLADYEDRLFAMKTFVDMNKDALSMYVLDDGSSFLNYFDEYYNTQLNALYETEYFLGGVGDFVDYRDANYKTPEYYAEAIASAEKNKAALENKIAQDYKDAAAYGWESTQYIEADYADPNSKRYQDKKDLEDYELKIAELQKERDQAQYARDYAYLDIAYNEEEGRTWEDAIKELEADKEEYVNDQEEYDSRMAYLKEKQSQKQTYDIFTGLVALDNNDLEDLLEILAKDQSRWTEEEKATVDNYLKETKLYTDSPVEKVTTNDGTDINPIKLKDEQTALEDRLRVIQRTPVSDRTEEQIKEENEIRTRLDEINGLLAQTEVAPDKVEEDKKNRYNEAVTSLYDVAKQASSQKLTNKITYEYTQGSKDSDGTWVHNKTIEVEKAYKEAAADYQRVKDDYNRKKTDYANAYVDDRGITFDQTEEGKNLKTLLDSVTRKFVQAEAEYNFYRNHEYDDLKNLSDYDDLLEKGEAIVEDGYAALTAVPEFLVNQDRQGAIDTLIDCGVAKDKAEAEHLIELSCIYGIVNLPEHEKIGQAKELVSDMVTSGDREGAINTLIASGLATDRYSAVRLINSFEGYDRSGGLVPNKYLRDEQKERQIQVADGLADEEGLPPTGIDAFYVLAGKYGFAKALDYIVNKNVLAMNANREAIDQKKIEDTIKRLELTGSGEKWVTMLYVPVIEFIPKVVSNAIDVVRDARYNMRGVASQAEQDSFAHNCRVINEAYNQYLSSLDFRFLNRDASFYYQAYCSFVDSAESIAVGGALGNLLGLSGQALSAFTRSLTGTSFFTNAMAQKLSETSHDPFADQSKALATSFATGLAEALFEDLSVDKFLKLSATASYVKALATSCGIEISEELCTELSNRITDQVINGYNSEKDRKIREYVAAGYSHSDAVKQEEKDFKKQLNDVVLSTILSTAPHSGGSIAVNNIRASKTGASLNANYSFNESQNYGAQLAQAIFEGKENLLSDEYLKGLDGDTVDAIKDMVKVAGEVVASKGNASNLQTGILYGYVMNDSLPTSLRNDLVVKNKNLFAFDTATLFNAIANTPNDLDWNSPTDIRNWLTQHSANPNIQQLGQIATVIYNALDNGTHKEENLNQAINLGTMLMNIVSGNSLISQQTIDNLLSPDTNSALKNENVQKAIIGVLKEIGSENARSIAKFSSESPSMTNAQILEGSQRISGVFTGANFDMSAIEKNTTEQNIELIRSMLTQAWRSSYSTALAQEQFKRLTDAKYKQKLREAQKKREAERAKMKANRKDPKSKVSQLRALAEYYKKNISVKNSDVPFIPEYRSVKDWVVYVKDGEKVTRSAYVYKAMNPEDAKKAKSKEEANLEFDRLIMACARIGDQARANEQAGRDAHMENWNLVKGVPKEIEDKVEEKVNGETQQTEQKPEQKTKKVPKVDKRSDTEIAKEFYLKLAGYDVLDSSVDTSVSNLINTLIPLYIENGKVIYMAKNKGLSFEEQKKIANEFFDMVNLILHKQGYDITYREDGFDGTNTGTASSFKATVSNWKPTADEMETVDEKGKPVVQEVSKENEEETLEDETLEDETVEEVERKPKVDERTDEEIAKAYYESLPEKGRPNNIDDAVESLLSRLLKIYKNKKGVTYTVAYDKNESQETQMENAQRYFDMINTILHKQGLAVLPDTRLQERSIGTSISYVASIGEWIPTEADYETTQAETTEETKEEATEETTEEAKDETTEEAKEEVTEEETKEEVSDIDLVVNFFRSLRNEDGTYVHQNYFYDKEAKKEAKKFLAEIKEKMQLGHISTLFQPDSVDLANAEAYFNLINTILERRGYTLGEVKTNLNDNGTVGMSADVLEFFKVETTEQNEEQTAEKSVDDMRKELLAELQEAWFTLNKSQDNLDPDSDLFESIEEDKAEIEKKKELVKTASESQIRAMYEEANAVPMSEELIEEIKEKINQITDAIDQYRLLLWYEEKIQKAYNEALEKLNASTVNYALGKIAEQNAKYAEAWKEFKKYADVIALIQKHKAELSFRSSAQNIRIEIDSLRSTISELEAKVRSINKQKRSKNKGNNASLNAEKRLLQAQIEDYKEQLAIKLDVLTSLIESKNGEKYAGTSSSEVNGWLREMGAIEPEYATDYKVDERKYKESRVSADADTEPLIQGLGVTSGRVIYDTHSRTDSVTLSDEEKDLLCYAFAATGNYARVILFDETEPLIVDGSVCYAAFKVVRNGDTLTPVIMISKYQNAERGARRFDSTNTVSNYLLDAYHEIDHAILDALSKEDYQVFITGLVSELFSNYDFTLSKAGADGALEFKSLFGYLLSHYIQDYGTVYQIDGQVDAVGVSEEFLIDIKNGIDRYGILDRIERDYGIETRRNAETAFWAAQAHAQIAFQAMDFRGFSASEWGRRAGEPSDYELPEYNPVTYADSILYNRLSDEEKQFMADNNLRFYRGVVVDKDTFEIIKGTNFILPQSAQENTDYGTSNEGKLSIFTFNEELDTRGTEANLDAFIRNDPAIFGMMHEGPYVIKKNYSKGKDFGPLRTNDEYIVTFDMDTTCPRAIDFNEVLRLVEEKFGRNLTEDEYFNLADISSINGGGIPCAYCYRYNKLALFSKYYSSFVESLSKVILASSDTDALQYMYGLDEEKGTLTTTAKKAFDVLRNYAKNNKDNLFAPTVKELYDGVQGTRNTIFNVLDTLLATEKIKLDTSKESLAKVLVNYYKKKGYTVVNNRTEAKKRGVALGIKYLEKKKGKIVETLNNSTLLPGLEPKQIDTFTQGAFKAFAEEWLADKREKKDHIYHVPNNIETEDIDTRYLSWNNAATTYANAASGAHTVDNYVPYANEFINLPKDIKAKINAMGGIRKHSSNDFRIDYIFDYLQFYGDLAREKMFGHTYTKISDYVRIFGRTGDRINMSIAAETKKGKVIENLIEGMAWKEARELREAYANAGIMAMVTDNIQLAWALNNPWVDMIIPFHASGLKKREWNNIKAWMNFQSAQNETFKYSETYMRDALRERGIDAKDSSGKDLTGTDLSIKYAEVFRKKVLLKDTGSIAKPHFTPYATPIGGEVVDFTSGEKKVYKTMEGHGNDLDTYFRLCDEFMVNPRFYGIEVDYKNPSTGVVEKIPVEQHPGYVKLIKETARTDTKQEAIQYTFDHEDEYLYKKFGTKTTLDYIKKLLKEESIKDKGTIAAHNKRIADLFFNRKYEGKERGWLDPITRKYKDKLIRTYTEAYDIYSDDWYKNLVTNENDKRALTKELIRFDSLTDEQKKNIGVGISIDRVSLVSGNKNAKDIFVTDNADYESLIGVPVQLVSMDYSFKGRGQNSILGTIVIDEMIPYETRDDFKNAKESHGVNVSEYNGVPKYGWKFHWVNQADTPISIPRDTPRYYISSINGQSSVFDLTSVKQDLNSKGTKYSTITDINKFDDSTSFDVSSSPLNLNTFDTQANTDAKFSKVVEASEESKNLYADIMAIDNITRDRETLSESELNNIKSSITTAFIKNDFTFSEKMYDATAFEIKEARAEYKAFLNLFNDINAYNNFTYYSNAAQFDANRRFYSTLESERIYSETHRKISNDNYTVLKAVLNKTGKGVNLNVTEGKKDFNWAKDLFYQLNEDKGTKELADKVFAVAEKLDLRIYAVPKIPGSSSAIGVSWGRNVEYDLNYLNNKGRTNQEKAALILHEIIHTTGSYVIMTSDKFLPIELRRAKLLAQKTFRMIKSDKTGLFKNEYGLTDEDEMLAELSNPEFVKKLKKKGLWQNIIDFFKQIFGIETNPQNAYDSAYGALVRMLENFDSNNFEAYAKYNDEKFGIPKYKSLTEAQKQEALDEYLATHKTDAKYSRMTNKEIAETFPVASAITLFSGGGTFEQALLGLINTQRAVEISERATLLYRLNYGAQEDSLNELRKERNRVTKLRKSGDNTPQLYDLKSGGSLYLGDVRDFVSGVELLQGVIDYLHASPSCQNFSSLKSKKREDRETEVDRTTAQATADTIEKVLPKIVTIENVPEYLHSSAYKRILDILNKFYVWDDDVYVSSDYGAPTYRKRMFTRAIRLDVAETINEIARKSGQTLVKAHNGYLIAKPEKNYVGNEVTWLDAIGSQISEFKDYDIPNFARDRLINGNNIDINNVSEPLLVMYGRPDGKEMVVYDSSEPAGAVRRKNELFVLLPGGVAKKVDTQAFANIQGLTNYVIPPANARMKVDTESVIGNGIPVALTRSIVVPLIGTYNAETKFSTISNENEETEYAGTKYSLAAPTGLTEKQIKAIAYNTNQTEIGSDLKTLSLSGGSLVARNKKILDGGAPAGKPISGSNGTQIYIHKNYATAVMDKSVYAKAINTLKNSYPDFEWNTIVYMKGKDGYEYVRFDEAPDFDTAREPIPGNYVNVNATTGEVIGTGNSQYIWHHKWMWVRNDYNGFDVGESWNWSKLYLSVIRDTKNPAIIPGTSKATFDNRGIANGSGKNGVLWNEQLRYFGLPLEGETASYDEETEADKWMAYLISNNPNSSTEEQKYKTSQNQVPISMTNYRFKNDDRVLDWGGGAYDTARLFMEDRYPGIMFLAYDPYNRTKSYNKEVLDEFKNNKASVLSINNVLNVIDSDVARRECVSFSKEYLMDNGMCVFVIYEGDGSGIGKVTKTGEDRIDENGKVISSSSFQTNMLTKDYIPMIKEYYEYAVPHGNIIFASDSKEAISAFEKQKLSDEEKKEVSEIIARKYIPMSVNMKDAEHIQGNIENKAPEEFTKLSKVWDAENPELFAAHNISTDNLLNAINLGGFPMPSIGIIRPDARFNTFGEYTVIFNKNAIDPMIDGNYVYGYDAWTPMYPPRRFVYNADDVAKFDEDMARLAAQFSDDPLFTPVTMESLLVDDTPKMEQIYFVRNLNRNDGVKAAYVVDRGLDVQYSKDYKTTAKRLLDAVTDNEEDFDNWFNEKFNNVNKISEVAARNGRYLEETLENVTDIMTHYPVQVGGGLGAFEMDALMARVVPAYQTINDIKQDSKRLTVDRTEKSKKEYRKIREALSKLREALILDGYDYDDDYAAYRRKGGKKFEGDFYGFDVVEKSFAKAAENFDINDIEGSRKKVDDAFGYNGITVSEKNLDTMLDLFTRAASLDTPYFEAKPRKAITFDSVMAVVAPNIQSAQNEEIAQKLNDMGISIVTYKDKDSKDRIRAMNEVSDAKFSKVSTGEQIKGFNVSDSQVNYTDRIFAEDPNDRKTIETRPSRSLDSLIGKRVAVISTDSAHGQKAYIAGWVTVGEPFELTEDNFDDYYNQHWVAPTYTDRRGRKRANSYYIQPGQTKWAYPLINPVKSNEREEVEVKGNVIRNLPSTVQKYSLIGQERNDQYADEQKNTAVYNDEHFFIGLFDTRDGSIVKTAPYSETVSQPNPFGDLTDEEMRLFGEGTYEIFYVDNSNLIIGDGGIMSQEHLSDLGDIPYILAKKLTTPYGTEVTWHGNGYSFLTKLSKKTPDDLVFDELFDGSDKAYNAIWKLIRTGNPAEFTAEVNRQYAGLSGEENIFVPKNDIPIDTSNETRTVVQNAMDKLIRKNGRLKEGEKAVDEGRFPERNDEGEYFRRMWRTISGSSNLTNTPFHNAQFNQSLTNDLATYQRTSNASLLDYADKEFERIGSLDKMFDKWKLMMDEDHRIDGKTIAFGEKLLVELANRNQGDDLQKALEVNGDLCVAGTELGVAVQAFRLLKKMTPAGQMYYLTKTVQRLNKKYEKQISKGKMQPIKIKDEDAKAIMSAGSVEELTIAVEVLKQDIANQIPVTFWDRWNAWRYLAMLGNFPTRGRNFLGNAGFYPMVATKNIIAAAYEDWFSSVDPSMRTKSFRYMLGGAPKELVDFATDYFEKQKDMIAGKNSKYNVINELLAKRDIWGAEDEKSITAFLNRMSDGKFGRAMNALQDINSDGLIGWMSDKAYEENWSGAIGKGLQTFKEKGMYDIFGLETGDIIFQKRYYINTLANFLAARGVTNPNFLLTTKEGGKILAEANAWAIREAQRNTYRDYNAIASGLNRLKATKANWFVEGIMPFTKAPMNILMRGIEYSPIGIAIGIKRIREARSIENEETRKAAVLQAIDYLAAGTTGIMVMAVGFALSALGLLRGTGSVDDKEKEFEKLLGHQDYAVEILDDDGNGVSVTIDWLAPVTMPLFVGAKFHDMIANGAPLSIWEIPQAMALLAEPMLSMSMLEGLENLINTAAYADSGERIATIGLQILGSYLTQGLPTLGAQVARSIVPDRRTTYVDKNSAVPAALQRFIQSSVMAKIPGLNNMRSTYVDAWGRTDTQDSWVLRWMENLLSPGYINEVKTTEVDRELMKLYEATQNSSLFPSTAQKEVNLPGGNKIYLTAEEYEQLAKSKGQTSYALLSEIFNDSLYAAIEDFDEKQKIVSTAYDYSKQTAIRNMYPDYKVDSWIDVANKIDVPTYVIMKSDLAEATSYSKRYDLVLNTPGLSQEDQAKLISSLYNASGTIESVAYEGYKYEMTDADEERLEELVHERFTEPYITLVNSTAFTEVESEEARDAMIDEVRANVVAECKRLLATEIDTEGNHDKILSSASSLDEDETYARAAKMSTEDAAKYIASRYSITRVDSPSMVGYELVFTKEQQKEIKAEYTELFEAEYKKLTSSTEYKSASSDMQAAKTKDLAVRIADIIETKYAAKYDNSTSGIRVEKENPRVAERYTMIASTPNITITQASGMMSDRFSPSSSINKHELNHQQQARQEEIFNDIMENGGKYGRYSVPSFYNLFNSASYKAMTSLEKEAALEKWYTNAYNISKNVLAKEQGW